MRSRPVDDVWIESGSRKRMNASHHLPQVTRLHVAGVMAVGDVGVALRTPRVEEGHVGSRKAHAPATNPHSSNPVSLRVRHLH